MFTAEEKLDYVDLSKFKHNVVNSPFAFIHVAWSSIASGFRSIYTLSEDDLIKISETDYNDFSNIVQAVLNTPGLINI
ncbi:hypothetical protein PIROE2DRAFT_5826 [Piromyces sp. E2]|nr:hypothetical protein PIROE2DRAFT_5826 [Piromyces sp. E2]|eukprot:OUM66846.1 hypothetical protein PIROE2DRAFT_5826 [Piromyces sp. E2]